MANKVMTAPLGIIKVQGVTIGKMRNITVTENLTRGRVSGIGQIHWDELPVISWNGNLNCSFWTVNFSDAAIPGAIQRVANSVTDWENSVLLQEDGVQIDIMRKIQTGPGTNGIPDVGLEIFVSVKGCFLTREGFDISQNQVSGRNSDFEYTNPILFHF